MREVDTVVSQKGGWKFIELPLQEVSVVDVKGKGTPQRKKRTFSYIKAEGNCLQILKVIVSPKMRYTVFCHHALTLILRMHTHVTLHKNI